MKSKGFDIYVVYDNHCKNQGFMKGFGFSVLIKNHYSKNYILFDVGEKTEILINNLKQLGLDLFKIEKIIISHNHFDHVGALDEILKNNEKIEIFIPSSQMKNFITKFPNATIKQHKEITEIEENVYITGELGINIKEQALVLKREEKIFLLVGCAHPGLEEFITLVKNLGTIEGILGGFHGFNKYNYLKTIKIIASCHCTQHKKTIMKIFPKQHKEMCIGDLLEF
ncbi:MAG: MBL fold metallo-hydrolase [Candidatus Lokiarchaeota archaeon]